MTQVYALRFPVPYGEPYESSELGRGVDRSGDVLSYLGGIPGVSIGDRVDSRVSNTRVKRVFRKFLKSASVLRKRRLGPGDRVLARRREATSVICWL